MLYKITGFIWLVAGALGGLTGLRFILKLVAANPDHPLTSFVYTFTQPFIGPLLGLTVSPSVEGMVVEFPSLIAMLVYGLAAWFIVRLIGLVLERPRARSV